MQDVFQNVFGITARGDTQHLEFGVLRLDLSAQILEHLDRVLDGIAVRKLVSLAEDVAPVVEQHSLGGSRATVDPDEAANGLALLERCWRKLFPAISVLESVKFPVFRDQTFRAGFGFLLLAAELDVVHQLLVALVTADTIVFAFAEFNRAQGGKILSVVWNLDQVFRLRAVGDGNFAFLPHTWNIRLPRLAHALDEAVWPAQQQHVRPKGVAAR